MSKTDEIGFKRHVMGNSADLEPAAALADSSAGEAALRVEPETVPGRACGECSLCCKVFKVVELDKPANSWCVHCRPGKGGCAIHDTRPQVCRGYFCLWMMSASLGDEWYPLNSRMVISREAGGHKVAIYVDPAYPRRWREAPYYAQIKSMSRALAEGMVQLVVYVGTKGTVVLPDKEVPVGSDDKVMLYRRSGPGKAWDVEVVKGDATARAPGTM